MTLAYMPRFEKYCLVYCGPERCNCQRGIEDKIFDDVWNGIPWSIRWVRDQMEDAMMYTKQISTWEDDGGYVDQVDR